MVHPSKSGRPSAQLYKNFPSDSNRNPFSLTTTTANTGRNQPIQLWFSSMHCWGTFVKTQAFKTYRFQGPLRSNGFQSVMAVPKYLTPQVTPMHSQFGNNSFIILGILRAALSVSNRSPKNQHMVQPWGGTYKAERPRGCSRLYILLSVLWKSWGWKDHLPQKRD